MSVHYNAFISYRHSPVDSEVAGRIQRQLEWYHIPRSIRKSSGIKRFDRVFRDKEELLLTDELGDHIEEALRNSDHLILICSPRTKESTWVQREIRLFLQTHSQDKVLIVVAEGEPNDVIPEILQDGHEPLCCDYRGSRRKAKQLELPRLAAAMLGCRYDDLRQRRKQRQMRLFTAFASVLLAFSLGLSFYFYRTNQIISESHRQAVESQQKAEANHQKALENQSRYLSSASLELLNSGDRLSAISLALEALPDGEEDRPWLPEAEYALMKATNAYVSSPTTMAIRAISHKQPLRDFLVTDDGKYLVALDSANTLHIRDMEQDVQVATISSDGYIYTDSLHLLPENRILLCFDNEILCYDLTTGALLWETPVETTLFTKHLVYPDGSRILIPGYGALYIYDLQNGSLLRQLELPRSEEVGGFSITPLSMSVTPLCVSDDQNFLAFHFSDFGNDLVGIYSEQENRYFWFPVEIASVYDAVFTANNQLVVAGVIDEWGFGTSFTGLGSVLRQEETELFCIRFDEGLLWELSLPHQLLSYCNELSLLQYPSTGTAPADAVALTVSNICAVVDTATGELLRRVEMPGSAVSVQMADGRLNWYLESGSYCRYQPGSDSVIVLPWFVSNLQKGTLADFHYILQDDASQILLYTSTHDDTLAPFQNPFYIGSPSYCSWTSNNQLLMIDYDGITRLCDTSTQSLLWELPISYDSYYLNELGFNRDETGFYIHKEAEFGAEDQFMGLLLAIDPETGTLTEIPLPAQFTEGYDDFDVGSEALIWGNRIAYVFRLYNYMGYDAEYRYQITDVLYAFDPESGDAQTYTLTENMDANTVYDYWNLHPDAESRQMLLSYGSETLLVDRDLGKCVPCDVPLLADAPLAVCDGAGLWAVTAEEGICLLSPDGSRITIPYEGRDPLSLCFESDTGDLLVLYADYSLVRYDRKGQILKQAQTEPNIYVSSRSHDVYWNFTAHGIMLQLSTQLNLLDSENLTTFAVVPNCLTYNSEMDQFVILGEDSGGMRLGYYHRYTTDDLMARAREILGTATLTPEQKAKYGLE